MADPPQRIFALSSTGSALRGCGWGTRGVVLDVPEMEDVEHFSWWLWLRRRCGDEVLEEVRALINHARGRVRGQ